MKIAVISDIHENINNLKKCKEILDNKNINFVIVLGDLVNPGIAKYLGENFKGVCILGNNDGDIYNISKNLGENFDFISKTYTEYELENKKFFLTHYDDLAQVMDKETQDFILYGHNHIKFAKIIRNCLVLNPGTLGGIRNSPSFAIIDTKTKNHEFIDL